MERVRVFAAIHQLISSFRVRAGDLAGARITSISGAPATRRRRVGGNGGPPLKASPLASPSSRRPTAAPTEGARCAARFNGCRQPRDGKQVEAERPVESRCTGRS